MSKGGIKKVTWIDARSLNADLDTIKAIEASKDGREFLVINTTYGTVRKCPEVVFVTTEICSNGDEEMAVIPKGWVVSIE